MKMNIVLVGLLIMEKIQKHVLMEKNAVLETTNAQFLVNVICVQSFCVLLKLLIAVTINAKTENADLNVLSTKIAIMDRNVATLCALKMMKPAHVEIFTLEILWTVPMVRNAVLETIYVKYQRNVICAL